MVEFRRLLRARRAASARDRGFTLLELTVTVALAGMILTAAIGGVFAITHTQADLTQRLVDSTDALGLSTWLPRDVNSTPIGQSAGTGIETGDLPSGCSTPGFAQGTGLLRLSWANIGSDGTTTPYRVSYRVRTVGGQTTLYRVACGASAVGDVKTVAGPMKTLNGGGLPISVDWTNPVITFTLIQHAGTPDERTIRIQAITKNSSTATLPPMATVVSDAKIVYSTTDITAGTTFTATLSGFYDEETVEFYVDYTTDDPFGSVVTNLSGKATLTLTAPLNAINGAHQIIAVGSKNSVVITEVTIATAAVSFPGGATASPGDAVTTRLVGFTSGESLSIYIDEPSGTPLKTVTYSPVSGQMDTTLNLATTTSGGDRDIFVVGATSKRRATASLKIVAGLAFSANPVKDGDSVTITASGAKALEQVTFTRGGTSIGTAVSDYDGISTLTTTIPDYTAAGNLAIALSGTDGTTASRNIAVSAATRTLTVSASTTTPAANASVTLTLTAKREGVTFTGLNGSQTVAITGAVNSPNGTTPTLPTTATFTDGVATVTVKLPKASSQTLSVTAGTYYSGTVTITPTAGTATSITSSPSLSTNSLNPTWLVKNGNYAYVFSAVDAFGNSSIGSTITATFAPTVGGGITNASGWTAAPAGWYSRSTTATASGPPLTLAASNASNRTSTITITVLGLTVNYYMMTVS